MEPLSNCSIGEKLESECHKDGKNRTSGFKELQHVSLEDQDVLKLRKNIKKLEDCKDICFYHERFFLVKYSGYQLTCCDPLQHHSKPVKRNLKVISLNYSKVQAEKGRTLVPGKKLCPRCFSDLENVSLGCENEMDTLFEPSDLEGEDVSVEHNKEVANTSLSSLECSPLKYVRGDRVRSYGKRKITEASRSIAANIAGALGDPSLETASFGDDGCDDCNELMEKVKLKILEASNQREKIQLLTLIPDSWSREFAAKFFNVSEYSIRHARELKRAKGILAMPPKRKQPGLGENICSKVTQFYQDDEISRLCPGKKDFVRVKNSDREKEKVQKRLLLGNLKEIYLQYKKENPDDKIGFSSFCELRPKQCVTVGSSGAHSVCVCTIHQNVKLMLAAIDSKLYYRDVLALSVCDIERKECMLHGCDKCPGITPVKNFLDAKIKENNQITDTISFKQWVSTDRSMLESKELEVADYIEEIAKNLSDLASHHYIAQHQSKFFKEIKKFIKNK